MSRGSTAAQTASTQGNTNATQAANNSQSFLNNSNALYSSVVPQLETEASAPSGFAPADEAAMNTASQESAGGSQAGAVGQGALLDARTRNKGGAAAAIDASSRAAGENLSRNALGIQTKNAMLKEEQRQNALSGLTGLTGLETGAANNALGVSNQGLGEVASNVGANTGAVNSSYDAFTDIINPLLGAAGSAGGAAIGKYCWIAEAIYGLEDERTHLLRAWLNGPFQRTWYGSLVMKLYGAIGQRVAKSKNVGILKPLFEMALRKARAWAE